MLLSSQPGPQVGNFHGEDLQDARCQCSGRQEPQSQSQAQAAGWRGLTPLGNTLAHRTGVEALCFGSFLKKKQNKKHIHTLQPHCWAFYAGFHECEGSIAQVQTICWCLQGDLVDLSLPSIREELGHWLIQDRSWLSIGWVNFHWRWRQHWLHVHHGRPAALMAILAGKGKTWSQPHTVQPSSKSLLLSELKLGKSKFFSLPSLFKAYKQTKNPIKPTQPTRKDTCSNSHTAVVSEVFTEKEDSHLITSP